MPTPEPAPPISTGKVVFAVAVGLAAVAGGLWLAARGDLWLGSMVLLLGLAAGTEPFVVRVGLRSVRLAHRALVAGAAAVFVAGLVASGSWAIGAALAAAIGLPFLVIGWPIVGVLPARVAARRNGLALGLRDLLAAPVRWGAAARTVEAFARLHAAAPEIAYADLGTAASLGADPGRLADAVGARVRSGRPAAFPALSAVAMAGHDPVALAEADDVVRALVAAETPG